MASARSYIRAPLHLTVLGRDRGLPLTFNLKYSTRCLGCRLRSETWGTFKSMSSCVLIYIHWTGVSCQGFFGASQKA